uniref:F-box domain-containing protein n=1 Tax=Ciona savignyi TaxID=51511 RepID=H2YAF5_CIOSA
MTHQQANTQVFEERKELIRKWFEKWNETQKQSVVNEILHNLSTKHQLQISETLKGKFPQEEFDFTRVFPRVLTLYLFSFLDPRTLCRCAQVSWYWNYLTELDSLWRPKCLRFGWYPTYQPAPFEEKIWKRFYVKTVHQLHYVKPKVESPKVDVDVDDEVMRTSRSNISIRSSSSMGLRRGPSRASSKHPLPPPKWEPPPWKGSDPRPTDTLRYNYLDNSSKKKKSSGPSGSRPTSRHGKRPTSSRLSSGGLNVSSDTGVIDPHPQSPPVTHTKPPAEVTTPPTNPENPPFTPNLARLSLDAGVRPASPHKVASNKIRSETRKDKENTCPLDPPPNTKLEGKGWSVVDTPEEDS